MGRIRANLVNQKLNVAVTSARMENAKIAMMSVRVRTNPVKKILIAAVTSARMENAKRKKKPLQRKILRSSLRRSLQLLRVRIRANLVNQKLNVAVTSARMENAKIAMMSVR